MIHLPRLAHRPLSISGKTLHEPIQGRSWDTDPDSQVPNQASTSTQQAIWAFHTEIRPPPAYGRTEISVAPEEDFLETYDLATPAEPSPCPLTASILRRDETSLSWRPLAFMFSY